LQSLNEARVALPIVSPRKFLPDYKVATSERDLSPLSIRSSDRIYILCVVSKSGKKLTLNLRSPIVVNLSRRLACQVIASESLPIAMPITIDDNQVRAAA
jgi:flagellar assembly factor FliW